MNEVVEWATTEKSSVVDEIIDLLADAAGDEELLLGEIMLSSRFPVAEFIQKAATANDPEHYPDAEARYDLLYEGIGAMFDEENEQIVPDAVSNYPMLLMVTLDRITAEFLMEQDPERFSDFTFGDADDEEEPDSFYDFAQYKTNRRM